LIHLNEIKNKINKKEYFYYLSIILIIFILDRYSKIKIIQNFNDKTFYVNDFLNLDLTWNTGVGFGLFSSTSDIYYNAVSVIIAIVILFIILYIINSKSFDKIAFSIILGGALGNFYDRIFYKAVPDFIDFHYNNFHWFTFNFADVFITLGVILYLSKNLLFNND
tara:strand:+ start:191 stop:685 length:495 start_codon:yes stop_codon:yes gene_type:complete